MKRIFKALAIVCLTVLAVVTLAACGSEEAPERIKIGIYNQAAWDGTGQSDNVDAYVKYLNENVKDAKGNPVFEIIKSNTTELAAEVSSFVAQDCQGIIVLNTKTTAAVEATCKKAGVYHINVSNTVSTADVGENPSKYCLGGVKNYFGDYTAFAKQWLDTVKADMAANNIETTKVSTVEFPANINPSLVSVVEAMQQLLGKGDYANITMGHRYISAGVPLANYIPGIVTDLKNDLGSSTSEAYGTKYVFGLANGAKTLTPYFTQGDFPGIKLCALGFSDSNYPNYDSYLLNQAECGLEGLAVGLCRIYQAVKGIECTDIAQFQDADGVVNVKTAWHIFNKTQYDAFVTHMYGGQKGTAKSNYTTNTPAIEASELYAVMTGNKLASLEALTARTIDQVVAAKGNK